MFPVEVEDKLLNSIRTPQDLANLYTMGVTIELFHIRKDIFKFIINYYKQYTKIGELWKRSKSLFIW